MKRNKNIFYFLIASLSLINLVILLKEIDKRKEILEDVKEYYCIELLSDKENVSTETIKKKCDYYSATGVWRD
tara:strand:+ start:10212 stop:10430 length:219 start_codon:yes stop_codon:yes gene_type:complete